MKTANGLYVLLVVGLIVFFSCEPVEKLSNVPEIHFKSLEGPFIVDTGSVPYHAVDLTFTFQDGDSDIGVKSDTSVKSNLILIPFQKINGIYDSLNPEIYGRKWKITEDEQLNTTRSVQGEIKVQIEYIIYPPPFDTLRYDFYITDQAGNMSNVETTTDIGFER